MIYRTSTLHFTLLSALFLLGSFGVVGNNAEDAVNRNATYLSFEAKHWGLPVETSAYVGTRVYVLSDPDAWLDLSNSPNYFLGRAAGVVKEAALAEGLQVGDAGLAGLVAWTNDPGRNTLLEAGDAIVTCAVTNASDAVVALFEVRTPVLIANSYDLTGSGNYPIWNRPEELHPADWSFTNLGSVFGTEVDADRNIYVTATSTQPPTVRVTGTNGSTLTNVNYQSDVGVLGLNSQPLTAATATQASGTIYKLDALTGTPTVFAQLPQQQLTINYNAGFSTVAFNLTSGSRTLGPGLGNIAFDDWHNQFFVTNFEDGKIYRIRADGTVEANPFDFGTPDDGAAGMPALGDRVWGVAVYKGRVYYSVWTDVACPNGNCGNPLNATAYQFTTNTPPAIRSVALDPVSGDFLPATDQLEWTGSDFTWNSPIADIDFNAEGQMVVAQKSILRDFSGYNHRSEVAVLTGGNGSWTADVFKTGPAESRTNSNRYGTEAYGGVDFGYNGATPDASVWYSSADMVRDGNIVNGSQGPHGFAGTLLSSLSGTDFPDPRAIVPYDPNVVSPSSIDAKGSGGELDIVNDYMSLGNLVWEDVNDDGLFNNGEPGIPNVRVRLIAENGITVIDSTLTNANGNYLFDKLFAGDYLVEIVPPAGYTTSTGSGFAAATGTSEPAPDPDTDAANNDDNGSMVGAVIRSEIVTLREITEPEDDAPLNDGTALLTDPIQDNNANYSVDFGLKLPPCNFAFDAFQTSDCDSGTNTFSATVTVTWTGNTAMGIFEYQVNGTGGYTPVNNSPTGESGTSQTIVIDGLDCDNTKIIEVRMADRPDCRELSQFVFPPIDPAGYIYCVEDGSLLTGSQVMVNTPPGGNFVFQTDASGTVLDGTNGRYAWLVTGGGSPPVAGRYTMSYVGPDGQTLVSNPATFGDGDNVLDPSPGTGDNPGGVDPLEVGSDINGAGTMLQDFSLPANPYFLEFDLAAGDPFIDLNNLPVTCCELSFTATPTCTFTAGTSTFTLDLTVATNTPPASEDLVVTFNGTELARMAPDASGTTTFSNLAVSEGPSYKNLLEVSFATTTDCGGSTFVDLLACTPDCVTDANTIGGNVFQDADNDGADAGAMEVGQENVLVEIYDCDGVLVCSTYTNADGNWSCDGLNDAEEYRVEFSTPLQPYLQSSFAGDDNGTNTQFVIAPSCEVDYGVINPADFCQDAPLIAFACYEPGSGVGQPGFAFLNVPYSAAGQGAVSNNYDATVDDIGTVWGVDYQRTTQYLYGATFLKRHSGIADDPSTIYVWDYSTDPTGPTGQFDLQGINPANGGAAIDLGTVNRTNVTGPIQAGAAGDFELPADKDEPNRDLDAYLKVGKMSYGDVALTEDGNTLWVFNLFQKALVSVDVSMADATNLPGSLGTVNQYPLSGLSGLPSCTSGELRPWAISFHEGLGYIGLVCDASASQDRNDLEAFVLSFDPDNIGAGLTTVVSFPLNYNREDLYYEFNGFTVGLVADIPGEWQPWIPRLPNTPDEFELRPIPVLSNIEFSEGGLEIALMDISAHTYGFENYPPVSGVELPLENKISAGDLVHFCENSGAYFAEGSPECPVFDDGQPNPGTGRTDDGLLNNGEFYYRDNFTIDADAPTYILLHGENASGSITVLPGTNEIVSMAFDPIQAADGGDVNTQGFSVYSTLDGSFVRGYEVVPMVAQTQGKGNGLGEPVLLCDPAPIQIGNYAWIDTDEDGVQDACEDPLPGLTVKLYRKDGTNDPIQIASTETDANGNYYFSSTSADDPNLNWTGTGADTSLQTGEEYFIAFCGDNGFDETDNTVEVDGINYCLTAADMGEGNNPDLNDSDATVQDIAGGMIPAYCTQPGEVDTTSHTFDVGFKPFIPCDLSITSVSPVCAYDPADGQSTFTVTVSVAWDYAELTTTNELIEVTFAGQTETLDPASAATGTGMVVFNGVAGPAYSQLVEAEFATNTTCSATSLVDLIACTVPCTDGLGGNTFNDLDNDGAGPAADPGEPGQENVLVEIYECDGMTPVYTTYTNADGDWTVPSSVVLNYPVRVEFSTPLQDYLQPSFTGDDNGSNTQFIDGPTCNVDYGVLNPEEFCLDDNLRMAVTCFVNGQADNSQDVLVAFDYNAFGGLSSGNKQNLATDQQAGATWGLAWDRVTERVFVGAAERRHVGYGPNGPGGIYAVDYSNPTAPVFSSFMTVSNAGTDQHTGLPAGGANLNPSYDLNSFALVGKQGLGDLDITADGKTLYVVNLNTRSLVEIDVATATETASYPFPTNLCNDATEVRPWAVKVYEGTVYAGMVCSGENDGTFNGWVLQLLDDGTFLPVTEVDLSYVKDNVWKSTSGACDFSGDSNWKAWNQNWPADCGDPFGGSDNYMYGNEQPILSDIEFDDDGSLILGFIDRFGMMSGPRNYSNNPSDTETYFPYSGGDILRFCLVGDTYIQEGNPGCAFSAGTNEYYNADDFTAGGANETHDEVSFGGLARVPGSDRIVFSAFDPINGIGFPQGVNTGGVRYANNTTGDYIDGLVVYANSINNPGTFGKTTGLGDLELFCPAPPIQIGNYVWLDEDADGIQDACEPPLPGVTVKLYSKPATGDPVLLATTTTDATGNYYFVGDGDDLATWEITDDAVTIGEQYFVAFCGDNGFDDAENTIDVGGVLYCLSPNDAGEGTNPDLNDSDATAQALGSLGTFPAYCTQPGETDTTSHTFDVGFKPTVVYDLALNKVIAPAPAPQGPFAPGDLVTFDITVYNQSDTGVNVIQVADYIPAGLTLADGNWTQVADTAYLVNPIDSLNKAGTIGSDTVLQITFMIDAGFMGTSITNNAEVESFDNDRDPNTPPPNDEDSNPGDNGNDPPEENTNDDVDDDAPGTPGAMDNPNDEDDFDPEMIMVTQTFDLALRKTLLSTGPFQPGSNVDFQIEIFNQGTLDATDVTITDYIPDGFLLADANWTADGDNATRTIAGPIAGSGGTATVTITLMVEPFFLGGELINYAEITDAMNALDLPDEDSTPGDNEDVDETGTDDNVDDDGPGGNGTPDDPMDNDDYDPAPVTVDALSIGSTVFTDPDDDGMFEPGDGEVGIAGVTVELLDDGGNVIATDTTDADGNYFFGGLMEGDYTVRIPVTDNFGAGEPLETNNLSSNPTDTNDNQEDNDDNGAQDAGAGTVVVSPVINLTIDAEPVDGAGMNDEAGNGADQDNLLDDNNGDMTIDFGFLPERVDVALRKTLVLSSLGPNGYADQNEILEFEITVFNQGNIPLNEISVVDYVPTGYDFAGTNTDFSAPAPVAGETYETSDYIFTFSPDPLAPGDSAKVSIFLEILPGINDPEEYINRAEVTSITDDQGDDRSGDDEDSTPNDNPDDDGGGGNDTPSDDETGGDGTGDEDGDDPNGDEDDEDPADPILYDLALTKFIDAGSIDPNGNYPGGTDVTFNIDVCNQGTDTVTNVWIKDYVPCGLDANGPIQAGLNTGWTAASPFGAASVNDSVFYLITDLIVPGECLRVPIVLRRRFAAGTLTQCGGQTPDDFLTNVAEIRQFEDTKGNFPPDFDSTPDGSEDNDQGGMVNDATDNVNTGVSDGGTGGNDPGTDEDDADPASLDVFDLAIYKVIDTLTSPEPYIYGDIVKFDIGVVSQGNLPATEIVIEDLFPPGLSFDPSFGDNTAQGWTAATGSSTTLTIDPTAPGVNIDDDGQPLGSGDTALVSIWLRIDPVIVPMGDSDYTNYAQIVSGTFENPTTGNSVTVTADGDSPYSLGIGNDTGGGIGSDDDNETLDDRPGEDIDSQDPAFVQVAGLTLGSTVFLDNNNDGLQNGVDTGIANVEVQLFDAVTMTQILTGPDGIPDSGDEADGPTVTDANGDYLFANLLPGDYYVVLPTAPATAPISSNNTGVAFTETDPDDDIDNDDEGLQPGGTGTSVSSDTITLEPLNEPTTADGETAQGSEQDENPTLGYLDENGNMTLDFGFFAPVSVGDTAFVDLDGDGMQAATDPGIGGVTVTLLDSNGDTVMVDAEGNAITGVTMTAADGSYLFENLPPGSYSVVFDRSTAENAEFYDFTTPNAALDALDSDNSITLSDSTAQSDPTPFLNSGEQDLTLDVGVICAVEVEVADPFTICSTQPIDLTQDASITPSSLGGTWTTSGDGEFLNFLGAELNGDPAYFFGEAVTYVPGPTDIRNGEVTLTLTTFNPAGPCEPVSNSVTVEVLKVDCGSFMWDGN